MPESILPERATSIGYYNRTVNLFSDFLGILPPDAKNTALAPASRYMLARLTISSMSPVAQATSVRAKI